MVDRNDAMPELDQHLLVPLYDNLRCSSAISQGLLGSQHDGAAEGDKARIMRQFGPQLAHEFGHIASRTSWSWASTLMSGGAADAEVAVRLQQQHIEAADLPQLMLAAGLPQLLEANMDKAVAADMQSCLPSSMPQLMAAGDAEAEDGHVSIAPAAVAKGRGSRLTTVAAPTSSSAAKCSAPLKAAEGPSRPAFAVRSAAHRPQPTVPGPIIAQRQAAVRAAAKQALMRVRRCRA